MIIIVVVIIEIVHIPTKVFFLLLGEQIHRPACQRKHRHEKQNDYTDHDAYKQPRVLLFLRHGIRAVRIIVRRLSAKRRLPAITAACLLASVRRLHTVAARRIPVRRLRVAIATLILLPVRRLCIIAALVLTSICGLYAITTVLIPVWRLSAIAALLILVPVWNLSAIAALLILVPVWNLPAIATLLILVPIWNLPVIAALLILIPVWNLPVIAALLILIPVRRLHTVAAQLILIPIRRLHAIVSRWIHVRGLLVIISVLIPIRVLAVRMIPGKETMRICHNRHSLRLFYHIGDLNHFWRCINIIAALGYIGSCIDVIFPAFSVLQPFKLVSFAHSSLLLLVPGLN